MAWQVDGKICGHFPGKEVANFDTDQIFYADKNGNRKEIFEVFYVPKDSIINEENYLDFRIWHRYNPPVFDDTCWVVFDIDEENKTWTVRVLKNYNEITQEGDDVSDDFSDMNIWLYNNDTNVRLANKNVKSREVRLNDYTTEDGIYRLELSQIKDSSGGRWLPAPRQTNGKTVLVCPDLLTIGELPPGPTMVWDSYGYHDLPFISLTSTSNMTLKNYSWFSKDNSVLNDAKYRMVFGYVGKASDGSDLYEVKSLYDESVITTNYNDSEGNALYKHTHTLREPINIVAGVKYLLNMTIKASWNTSDINYYAVSDSIGQYDVHKIPFWVISNLNGEVGTQVGIWDSQIPISEYKASIILNDT